MPFALRHQLRAVATADVEHLMAFQTALTRYARCSDSRGRGLTVGESKPPFATRDGARPTRHGRWFGVAALAVALGFHAACAADKPRIDADGDGGAAPPPTSGPTTPPTTPPPPPTVACLPVAPAPKTDSLALPPAVPCEAQPGDVLPPLPLCGIEVLQTSFDGTSLWHLGQMERTGSPTCEKVPVAIRTSCSGEQIDAFAIDDRPGVTAHATRAAFAKGIAFTAWLEHPAQCDTGGWGVYEKYAYRILRTDGTAVTGVAPLSPQLPGGTEAYPWEAMFGPVVSLPDGRFAFQGGIRPNFAWFVQAFEASGAPAGDAATIEWQKNLRRGSLAAVGGSIYFNWTSRYPQGGTQSIYTGRFFVKRFTPGTAAAPLDPFELDVFTPWGGLVTDSTRQHAFALAAQFTHPDWRVLVREISDVDQSGTLFSLDVKGDYAVPQPGNPAASIQPLGGVVTAPGGFVLSYVDTTPSTPRWVAVRVRYDAGGYLAGSPRELEVRELVHVHDDLFVGLRVDDAKSSGKFITIPSP